MWKKRTFKYRQDPLRAMSIFPQVIDPRVLQSYVWVEDRDKDGNIISRPTHRANGNGELKFDKDGNKIE